MIEAQLKTLLDGGRYYEAPRWHRGRLWFVDCMARTLLSVGPSGDHREHATFADDTPCGYLRSVVICACWNGCRRSRDVAGRPYPDVLASAGPTPPGAFLDHLIVRNSEPISPSPPGFGHSGAAFPRPVDSRTGAGSGD
jgi:hypothetical protein